MSQPSLSPPPRRVPSSSSGIAARRPKVNPNSLALAASMDVSALDQQGNDQGLDKALAQLLSQTHIVHPDYLTQHHNQHLPQCRHYSRPRSTASISSLNSSSAEYYSIYPTAGTATSAAAYCGGAGGAQGSRRTSQVSFVPPAPRSPLFPELSEPAPSPVPSLLSGASSSSTYFINHASARPCFSCHSYSCPSLAIYEEEDDKVDQRGMTSPGSGHEAIRPFCQRGDSGSSGRMMKTLFPPDADLDLTNNNNNNTHMESAVPFPSSCSYCSSMSVRSDSVSSIAMDDQGGLAHHLYHSSRESGNQLFDEQRMKYLRTLVPNQVRRRLSFHLDECWFVHFSPSAEYLASIGLDHSIHLWKDLTTLEPSVFKTFNYSRTLTHAKWSPNSRYLLANLGNDVYRPAFIPELNLIDVQTGEIVFKKSYKNETSYVCVNAIGWFSDSERFLTALDDGLYCIWNVRGEIVREFPVDNSITAFHMCMIPGKDEAVIYTKAHTLDIISFDDEVSTRRLDQSISVATSMNMSDDGTYLALGFQMNKELPRPAHIALYDLKSMTFLRSFEAESYINDFFVIIPTFAGPNQELLCAGSENGKLHFWDLESGEVVSVLEEHSMHSGCMAVNPKHPGMIASCSDDNQIIIWATKELQLELQEDDEQWIRKHPVAAMPAVAIRKGW